MCEYCGCQHVPAIAQLTSEHDEIRALARDAGRAARTGDFPAARSTIQSLRALLAPHTAVEEHGLFPAMAGEFPDHVASLEDDHRRIDRALQDLATAEAPYYGWAGELSTAVGTLFEHILREQDGLFPASLSVLSPSQWEELDAVRSAVTADGVLPYPLAGRL